jgi:hypothetical protein
VNRTDYLFGLPESESARVSFYLKLFEQRRLRRVNFEPQWQEAAALAWPEYMNTFTYGHVRSPGVKYTQYQVDSTAAIASHQFMSIVDSIATPHTMMWSKITCSNNDVMKSREARLYFDEVTQCLWKSRYDHAANFLGQNQQNLQGYGVFGNMGMFVDKLIAYPGKEEPGLSYKSTPVGEIYVLQNFQGLVDGYIRHFRVDARGAAQRWGYEKLPAALRNAVEISSSQLFNFMEIVHPRTDWMPWAVLSPKGKRFTSCYISIEGHCILEEGGYNSFPLAYGRYMQAPEEEYGRGPAQMVLPALKTLNALKTDYLEQGHLAIKPAYLIGDDGLMDFKSHAGAYNYGGVTADGRPLVHTLPNGQIQAGEELMTREERFVNDAFLVSLYRRMWDDAKTGTTRTAREVIEDANDRGIFLAPALGRLCTEYLGPLIHRELDLLSWLRKLPPMPGILREANGEYEICYTSPLARAVRNQEVAGAMQTVEFAQQVVNVTGDNSLLDIFDFNSMLSEMGDIRNVPERWFADAASRAKKAQARQQAQEREMRAKEAPSEAAKMKAQAVMIKAQSGGNIGGTLSGTAPGGMPQMPGSPGLPGAPGNAGQVGRPGIPGTPGGY